MTGDWLARAREQAEQSSPPVRAAAWLHIARVEQASEPEQARLTLIRGLEEVRQLTGRDGEFLQEQAELLVAAVAPDLLREMVAAGSVSSHVPRRFRADRLPRVMIEHGHLDAAFEYAMAYDEAATFPFRAIDALMKGSGDAARQLAVLRRAIEAWRAEPCDGFIGVLQHHWNQMPREMDQPDREVTASFDREGTLRMTSGRDLTLFHILHVLRHLDAPLAESLIAGHPQLAAVAHRYPYGLESIQEEAEARPKESGKNCGGGGYVMAGSREDFPYLKALMQASMDGDFSLTMKHALEKYRQDAGLDGPDGSPNGAPREFWPSTGMYRSILYRAGKRLGEDAAVYLDAIPDADLRLFAQIELAAALAGLPELQGTQRIYRPGLRRPRPGTPQRRESGSAVHEAEPVIEEGTTSGRGPSEPRIRCPKCSWQPCKEDRWSCKCGHLWNTFDTGGVCPGCLYQWKITMCPKCGEWSPHSDWYAHE